jgi:hypothetical protein
MNQDEILKCPQIGNAFLSRRFNVGFGELIGKGRFCQHERLPKIGMTNFGGI